jgi:protein-tyrosine-phosphatase
MLSHPCLIAIIAGALLAAPALPQRASHSGNADAKVLFVCEHGAAKSVIAAAQFNKLASERGLRARAIARGTNPDAVVSPKVAAGLRAEGFKDITQKPLLVTDEDVSKATRVVTMGCRLPQKAAATDWNDIPSVSEDYPAASRTIQRHVEALIDELARSERHASERR